MKSLGLLATVCATAALAKGPERVSNAARSITIEVAPGETRQITEDERWDIATVSLWWLLKHLSIIPPFLPHGNTFFFKLQLLSFYFY